MGRSRGLLPPLPETGIITRAARGAGVWRTPEGARHGHAVGLDG